MKLGTAAKQCAGKKKDAFRKCVVQKMKGLSGYSKSRRPQSRR